MRHKEVMDGLSSLFLCLLLLVISVSSVNGQDSRKIDSLQLLYEAEEVDSLKYQALRLYEKEVRKSDRVEALPLMKDRLKLAEKVGNNDWVLKSYLTLGNNYMYLAKNDSARMILDLCLEKARDLGDINLISATLNSSAVLYQRVNNYENSIETYHETILLSDSLGDYIGQLIGYGNLSAVLMEQGNPERALEHLLKTENLHADIIKQAPEDVEEFESFLTATYGNIAMCYQSIEENDSANHYFEKALSFIPRIKDSYSSTYYSSFVNHGIADIEIDKCFNLSTCNERVWNRLLTQLLKAKAGFYEIEYDRGIAFALLDIGRALDGLGRHTAAKDSLDKALDYSFSMDYIELTKDAYKALAFNAERLKNYKSANYYLRNWTQVRDKLRNEQRDKFTQQKEIELETFQKENEILQLQVEAEAQSRRQAQQLFAFIIVLFSVLGGAYILYSRYKLKKERELAIFQKEVNKAMSKFVPMAFIRAIGREAITEVELGDQVEKEVTVLFTDIRDFTTMSEKMLPSDNFKFVKDYAALMGPIIEAHNGFVNQYLGDGIMAIFENNPNDALDACIEMQTEIKRYNLSKERNSENPIRVGMGMHTGPLVMGIIGDQTRRDATIISDTVNSAARIEKTTKMYKQNILISGTSFDKLINKERYKYHLMGDVNVKGKKIAMEVYAVEF